MTAESKHCLPKSIGLEDAAKYLNIPVLAIGQLIFEGRLKPTDGFSFQQHQLDSLKQGDLTGYR